MRQLSVRLLSLLILYTSPVMLAAQESAVATNIHSVPTAQQLRQSDIGSTIQPHRFFKPVIRAIAFAQAM